MKKICSGCGQELDIEEFGWKQKDRGIRHSRCKSCLSQAHKRHYENNKQIYLQRARTRETRIVEDNQNKLIEYLTLHPCIDCGQTDIRVLEFDHIRGKKTGNISRMVMDGLSWTTIEAEIAKCEVRCANCHRRKTYERNSSWRQFLK